jgi:hypothetical protein
MAAEQTSGQPTLTLADTYPIGISESNGAADHREYNCGFSIACECRIAILRGRGFCVA